MKVEQSSYGAERGIIPTFDQEAHQDLRTADFRDYILENASIDVLLTRENLLKKANYLKPVDLEIVRDAFDFGYYLHATAPKEANRSRGTISLFTGLKQEYFVHPGEIAQMGADLGVTKDALVVQLLHDTFEDTRLKELPEDERNQIILGRYNETVLKGIITSTKITGLDKKQALKETNALIADGLEESPEGVLAKILDTVHNMKTIGGMPVDKRKAFAGEKMRFIAKLANRVGMWREADLITDLGNEVFFKKETDAVKKLIESDYSSKLTQRKFRPYERDLKMEFKKKFPKSHKYGLEFHYRDLAVHSFLNPIGNNEVEIKPEKSVPVDIVCWNKKMFREAAQYFRERFVIELPTDKDAKELVFKFSQAVNNKTTVFEIHLSTFDEFQKREASLASLLAEPYRAEEMTEIQYKIASERRSRRIVNAIPKIQRVLDLRKQIADIVPLTQTRQFSLESHIDRFIEAIQSEQIPVYVPEDRYGKPTKKYEISQGYTVADLAYFLNIRMGRGLRSVKVNGEKVPLSYVIQPNDRVIMDWVEFDRESGQFSESWTTGFDRLGEVTVSRYKTATRGDIILMQWCNKVIEGYESELKKAGISTFAELIDFLAAKQAKLDMRVGIKKYEDDFVRLESEIKFTDALHKYGFVYLKDIIKRAANDRLKAEDQGEKYLKGRFEETYGSLRFDIVRGWQYMEKFTSSSEKQSEYEYAKEQYDDINELNQISRISKEKGIGWILSKRPDLATTPERLKELKELAGQFGADWVIENRPELVQKIKIAQEYKTDTEIEKRLQDVISKYERFQWFSNHFPDFESFVMDIGLEAVDPYWIGNYTEALKEYEDSLPKIKFILPDGKGLLGIYADTTSPYGNITTVGTEFNPKELAGFKTGQVVLEYVVEPSEGNHINELKDYLRRVAEELWSGEKIDIELEFDMEVPKGDDTPMAAILKAYGLMIREKIMKKPDVYLYRVAPLVNDDENYRRNIGRVLDILEAFKSAIGNTANTNEARRSENIVYKRNNKKNKSRDRRTFRNRQGRQDNKGRGRDKNRGDSFSDEDVE